MVIARNIPSCLKPTNRRSCACSRKHGRKPWMQVAPKTKPPCFNATKVKLTIISPSKASLGTRKSSLFNLTTMKKLGLGVLGLGEGRSIISGALNSPLWEVIRLCDLNEDLGRERCHEFGLSRFTTSMEELLADPRVEVVGI